MRAAFSREVNGDRELTRFQYTRESRVFTNSFTESICMNPNKFAVAIIIGVMVTGSLGQKADSQKASRLSQDVPKTATTESSLQPILDVLSKAKLSGSLEFSGNCNMLAFPGYPEFPQVHSAAAIAGPPLHSLRRIFAHEPAMRVTKDPDGRIRMVERGLSTDILNLRIHHISFDRDAYDPNVAAEYIMSAPEVTLFMKSHDIHWPFGGGGVLNAIAGKIPPTSPHISGSMDNITLSGAMDRVLKTFPGLWIYQNCPRSDKRPRIIYFKFYELQGNPHPVLIPIHDLER